MSNQLNLSFHDPVKNELMPEGKYLVIDPCYVFGHIKDNDVWDKFCDALQDKDGNSKEETVAVVGDYSVHIFSTAYGDGSYPVYVDRELVGYAGVDAGLLCFIPEGLMNSLVLDGTYSDTPTLGVWVETYKDDFVRYLDGDACVANVEIITGDDGCDDEDEDIWGDDDDWDDEDEYDD